MINELKKHSQVRNLSIIGPNQVTFDLEMNSQGLKNEVTLTKLQKVPSKLYQGMFHLTMSKPLPLLEANPNTFVKLSRKVTLRLGQQDENPLIADA